MKEKNDKHLVYILRCRDNTLYTGYTTDIDRRLHLHEKGKGAKYTRGRAPLRLVYSQAFSTKSEALRAEIRIKKMTRKEKERLIKERREIYETSEK